MTFSFIDEHRGQWPVRLLCAALDVSAAGYYAWWERPASARQQRQDALLVEIRAIHAEVKGRYGSPRIHAELAARGQDCCVNTVAKLMRDHDIGARTARKFRCTTDSNHDLPVAENVLDRPFDPAAPNEAWVADIRVVRGGRPIDPDSVRRYLEGKFGDDLKAVRSATQSIPIEIDPVQGDRLRLALE